MEKPPVPGPDGLNKVSTFATLGAIATSNHLIAVASDVTPGANHTIISEETMALLAVVTTRSLEFGLAGNPSAQSVLAASAEMPFLYRDYVLGRALLDGDDSASNDDLVGAYNSLADRLEFYFSHLAPGQFPGKRVLSEKMLLWIGRISVPGLDSTPAERLDRIGGVEEVLAHAKLVLGFVRQQG